MKNTSFIFVLVLSFIACAEKSSTSKELTEKKKSSLSERNFYAEKFPKLSVTEKQEKATECRDFKKNLEETASYVDVFTALHTCALVGDNENKNFFEKWWMAVALDIHNKKIDPPTGCWEKRAHCREWGVYIDIIEYVSNNSASFNDVNPNIIKFAKKYRFSIMSIRASLSIALLKEKERLTTLPKEQLLSDPACLHATESNSPELNELVKLCRS